MRLWRTPFIGQSRDWSPGSPGIIKDLTQLWIDGAAENYGVMLLATNEDVDGYDLRFRSSDYATANAMDLQFRPKLEICWTLATRTTYFLKDHLGTTRAAITDAGKVVGYDDYDPWGLILANRSMTSQANMPYKFTGKEWDDDFGLNLYHFGARTYDPLIGRWNGVDPLAIKYPDWSPYNYTLDNPINSIDIDGRDVFSDLAQKHRVKNEKEAATIAFDIIRQMETNKRGRFSMTMTTTKSRTRSDLRQVWNGAGVDFDYNDVRFIVNTMLSLNKNQVRNGYFTVGGFFDLRRAPLQGKDKWRMKFSALGKKSDGGTFIVEKVLILIGTIENLNKALKQAGYKISDDKNGLDKIEDEKQEEGEDFIKLGPGERVGESGRYN